MSTGKFYTLAGQIKDGVQLRPRMGRMGIIGCMTWSREPEAEAGNYSREGGRSCDRSTQVNLNIYFLRNAWGCENLGSGHTSGARSATMATNLGQLQAPPPLQWPRNLCHISGPFCQKIIATPMSAPPAITPEATGNVNSSALAGDFFWNHHAMTAPIKNSTP